jgi:hypothetical protein
VGILNLRRTWATSAWTHNSLSASRRAEGRGSAAISVAVEDGLKTAFRSAGPCGRSHTKPRINLQSVGGSLDLCPWQHTGP